MKPLQNIEAFLKRFNHFKDGEFRSIKVLSVSSMLVTLTGQDEAREFDWQNVSLEFHGVTDAQLLEDKKLKHLDMSDGISIIKTDNSIAFSIGDNNNLSTIKTSSCYIESINLKYEESKYEILSN